MQRNSQGSQRRRDGLSRTGCYRYSGCAPHLARCLRACVNELIVLIDFFKSQVTAAACVIHRYIQTQTQIPRHAHITRTESYTRNSPPQTHTYYHTHTNQGPTSTHSSREPWVMGVVPEYCPRLGGGGSEGQRKGGEAGLPIGHFSLAHPPTLCFLLRGGLKEKSQTSFPLP